MLGDSVTQPALINTSRAQTWSALVLGIALDSWSSVEMAGFEFEVCAAESSFREPSALS